MKARAHDVALGIALAQRGPWIPEPRDPYLPATVTGSSYVGPRGFSFYASGDCVSIMSAWVYSPSGIGSSHYASYYLPIRP